MYKDNPKTKGSGVLCAIPQTGVCPVDCEDCFFQSGRSYLEPLDENLPNVPTPSYANGFVVRMNDGNDSNVDRAAVLASAKQYGEVFFNTSITSNIADFPGPVVLTINPSDMTDKAFHQLDPVPRNLMFVRFRTNMWNLDLLDQAVEMYTEQDVPVVLTFMAYYNMAVDERFKSSYSFRKRTINSYWVLNTDAWDSVVERYKTNKYVYTCGKDATTSGCKYCGTCLREYYATKAWIAGL